MKILFSTRKRRVSVQLPSWRTPEESSREVVCESPKRKRFLGFRIDTRHVKTEVSCEPLPPYSTDDVFEYKLYHELPGALDWVELPGATYIPELDSHALISELDSGCPTSVIATFEQDLVPLIVPNFAQDEFIRFPALNAVDIALNIDVLPSFTSRHDNNTISTSEIADGVRDPWPKTSYPISAFTTSSVTPVYDFLPAVWTFNPPWDMYRSARLHYQPSDGDPYAGANPLVRYPVHTGRGTSQKFNPMSTSETGASTDTSHCSPYPIESPTTSKLDQSSKALGSTTSCLLEATSQDLVKRSMSTPLKLAMLASFFDLHHHGDCPARSASAPHPQEQEDYVSLGSGQLGAALNGVSLYYASKNKAFAIEPDGTRVVQLTNSQKIRRCASFNSFTGSCDTNTNNNIIGTLSLSNSLREAILKDLPFADLLRSGSLEDTALYQSVQQLKHTKKMMNDMVKPRHRFRGGRISGSGKERVRRAAYPPLKCDQCRRVFDGNDRKRKLARHRRRVHACGSIKLNPPPAVQYPTLVCEHCHLNFTGVQAKGNLDRHMELEHTTSTKLLWQTQDYIPWASERVSQPPAERKP